MSRSDSREEILEATLDVLIDTGFSNLTFSKIAEEADISKSLINYHFDTKKDLVIELVDWMTTVTLSEKSVKNDGENDKDYLLRLLIPEGEQEQKIQRAILELGTVSPHNEEIAEKFREMHQSFKEQFERVIDSSEDLELQADFVLSALLGLGFRRQVIGEEIDVEGLEEKLREMLD